MKNILLICFCIFLFLYSFSQDIKLNKIQSLKTDSYEMPSGFILMEERLSYPSLTGGDQIFQMWKRDHKAQKLLLFREDTCYMKKHLVGSNIYQYWSNSNNDLIEVQVEICSSSEEMENTIHYYTQEAFSVPFKSNVISLVGERSWILKNTPLNDNFVIMFTKYNVFIRVFLCQKNTKSEKIKELTEKISKQIESKIITLKF